MGIMSSVISSLYHCSTVGSAVTMIYFARPGSSLFSWHPFLMTTAVSLLMSEGLTVYSKNYAIISKRKHSTVVTFHWILQGSALVAMYAGLGVIYATKNVNAKPHFTSLHGRLGVLAIVVASSAAIGGNLLKYCVKVPFVSTKTLRSIHAVGGKSALAAGYVVLTLGLLTNWAVKEMNLWGRCGIGSATVLLAGILINETKKALASKKNKT